MEKGQKFLVIRYGKNIVDNCIEKHIDVLSKLGSCWFGKIGTAPSQKFINMIMSERTPRLILYSKEEVFECDITEVSYEKPQNEYPEYYDEKIFGGALLPKIYFRLSRIEKIDKKELTDYIIVSSRGKLIDTLNRSMTSFFLAEYPDKSAKNKKDTVIKEYKIKESKILDVNDCIYRNAGVCNCKGFINYNYECERPSSCIKQKRW